MISPLSQKLIPRHHLNQVASKFKLLGEPVRLEILNLLLTNDEMNVQEIIRATDQGQANVSKHLKLMANAHFVGRRKEGQHVYYRVIDPSLSGLCLLVCSTVARETTSLH